MEGTLDSCFDAAITEGPGAERPSAPSERRAVGGAESRALAEEPLLSEGAGAVGSGQGYEQQSALERSALKEWEQSSSAQRELPSEGLGSQEVIRNNKQSASEADAPFSASFESTSPVTSEIYSTLPEVRNSEREEHTSQNSVLSENTATVTGKEVIKVLDIRALKRGFFFNLIMASRTPHTLIPFVFAGFWS